MFIPASRETTIQAASGTTTIFALPAPPRGMLSRIVVKQTSGTLEGFEFSVLDQQSPTDADLHTIVGKVTVSAGTGLYANYALSAYYENRDPRPDTMPRRTGAIYLSLKPSGSGTKNFAVAWTASAANVV